MDMSYHIFKFFCIALLYKQIDKFSTARVAGQMKLFIETVYIFYFSRFFFICLKLTSHSVLHYLWSADLLKGFSQLTMSLFFFSQYYFQ